MRAFLTVSRDGALAHSEHVDLPDGDITIEVNLDDAEEPGTMNFGIRIAPADEENGDALPRKPLHLRLVGADETPPPRPTRMRRLASWLFRRSP